MNSIKNRALIGTSIASVVLFYTNVFLVGLIVGLRKTMKPTDDPKAVPDIMDRPL